MLSREKPQSVDVGYRANNNHSYYQPDYYVPSFTYGGTAPTGSVNSNIYSPKSGIKMAYQSN